MSLRRLLVLPAVLVGLAAAVPAVAGDEPLPWSTVEETAAAGAERLPGPVRALVPLGPQVRPQYVEPVAVPGAPAAPAPVLRPVRNPYPVETVRSPWTPGAAELGVQLYWRAAPGDDTEAVWRHAQRVVDHVVGLGANAVAVSFPVFTDGISSSRVFAGDETPSPDHLDVLVRQANAAGLRVTLRPILDEASLGPPTGWRGNITPTSTAAWFASYRDLLAPYLDVAQRRHVATFVVGTELNSMEPADTEWTGLVTWAGTRYAGQVAYHLNWDNFIVGKYPRGAAGYGVDAYFPVFTDDSAPSSVIAQSWIRTLTTAPPGPPGPLVLSEVGISAKRGAYQYPAAYSGIGTYDDRIQPTWFRGVCAAARDQRLAGLYFWKVDFHADPRRPARQDRPTLDFLGQPGAETAIRECFAAPWRVAGS